MKNMPASVTTNGVSSKKAIRSPSVLPVKKPAPMPAATPSAVLCACNMTAEAAIPAAPIVDPTDRSIPAEMITNVAPIAAIPSTAFCWRMFRRFCCVRKSLVVSEKTAPIVTSAGISARSRRRPITIRLISMRRSPAAEEPVTCCTGTSEASTTRCISSQVWTDASAGPELCASLLLESVRAVRAAPDAGMRRLVVLLAEREAGDLHDLGRLVGEDRVDGTRPELADLRRHVCIDPLGAQRVAAVVVAVDRDDCDVLRVTDRIEVLGRLERRDNRRQEVVRRIEDRVDLRMRLERVGDAVERRGRVPVRRELLNDLDARAALRGLEEPVATPDRVGVGERPDHEQDVQRPVQRAHVVRNLGAVAERIPSHLRDDLSALAGSAVDRCERNARTVCSTDRRDDLIAVLRDRDHACDVLRDEVLDLLRLLIGVVVRDGEQNLDVLLRSVLLDSRQLCFADLVQQVKADADRRRCRWFGTRAPCCNDRDRQCACGGGDQHQTNVLSEHVPLPPWNRDRRSNLRSSRDGKGASRTRLRPHLQSTPTHDRDRAEAPCPGSPDENGDDEHGRAQHVEDVRGDVSEDETVGDHLQKRDAEQAAEDAAFATEEARPAEHDRRDDGQLFTEADRWLQRAEPAVLDQI